ncbi:MAG: synthase protein [Rhizobacter sp.]|nr:synthase protein [Rhizobacter sp.]
MNLRDPAKKDSPDLRDSPDPPDEQRDPLLREVRLRSLRQKLWHEEGAPSVARRLAQIGVLGWMIVTPMLLGVAAGRWLDRHFDTSVFFTAPMLMAGLAIGCWSAWKWMGNA